MPRPLRIEYEDAFYHVMNRGAGRRRVFQGDAYYQAFLETLAEAHLQFGIEVHAYCLMRNHYHLLVKTPRANLGRAMRHVNGVYTQRHNKLRKTDGPVFRGRYKAIVVDSDAYLLQLSKYIHHNPRAAGLVEELTSYPWSSYPSYINQAETPPWLVRDQVYGQLTITGRPAGRYRKFMNDEAVDDAVLAFYARRRWAPILGNDDFVEKVSALNNASSGDLTRADRGWRAPAMDAIIQMVGETFQVDRALLIKPQKGRGRKNLPRKVAMYVLQKAGDYRLNDIAKAFGLAHYGGVSSAIHFVAKEMAVDKTLAWKIKTIINILDP